MSRCKGTHTRAETRSRCANLHSLWHQVMPAWTNGGLSPRHKSDPACPNGFSIVKSVVKASNTPK